VWPLDPKADVLRVGRQSVERWAHVSGGLRLQGQRSLSGGSMLTASELSEALGSLFSDGIAPRRRRTHVALESCWLPVMLIPLGDSLWSRRQVGSLMRHRVQDVYGSSDAREIVVQFRAGDSLALGYALSGDVRGVLEDSLSRVHVSPVSLQPACAWGWKHLAKHRKTMRQGWWVWLEQDRSLIAWTERGRWTSLNAAAPVLRTTEELRPILSYEGVRTGTDDAPVGCIVAGWEPAQAPPVVDDCRVSWLTVVSSASGMPVSPASVGPDLRDAA
jgi:hypothetical protein